MSQLLNKYGVPSSTLQQELCYIDEAIRNRFREFSEFEWYALSNEDLIILEHLITQSIGGFFGEERIRRAMKMRNAEREQKP
jgi:hypothetical protein